MRTFLAIVILVGGIFAISETADAARKKKRYSYYPRADSACELRAEHADRTGVYRGYPCWAREALGQGTLGGGRGRR